MPYRSTFVLALPFLLLASLAPAQADPQPFVYQGVLTESDLPANGLFDFEARIFTEAMPADPPPDDPVLPLSVDAFEGVSVAGGLFSLEIPLAQSVLDAHAAGEPIFLELGVRVGTAKDGYTTLTPRTRLRPTPFASFADQPVATLQSVFDAGPTITSLPGSRLSVLGQGESLFTTPFYINRAGSDTITNADLSLIPGDQGGRIILRDLGETLVNIAPDPDNTGGFLSVARGGGSTGFAVDGNFENSQSARVTVSGTGSATVIDASESGNASVVLPASSIDATEMFNEPGIAADRATPNATLPHLGQLQIVATRTITVPDAGFVLVTGSMETLVVGPPTGLTGVGMDARIDYGISTTGTSIANGMDYTYIFRTPPLLGANPTQPYELGNTLPFTDVIEVTQGGPVTISAVARFTSPNVPEPICTVRDVNINLLYVPTSYGMIALTQRTSAPDHVHPPTRPSVRDLLAERDAEIRRYRAEQAERHRAAADRIARLEAQLRRALDALDEREPEG